LSSRRGISFARRKPHVRKTNIRGQAWSISRRRRLFKRRPPQGPRSGDITCWLVDRRLCAELLDRTIFNVLIEPIKKEFALSDTTMGLLAGFGFVLFYSLLGIPIARLADRFNRRNIVAVALAFWSAASAMPGRPAT
jgi:hypothetical protein